VEISVKFFDTDLEEEMPLIGGKIFFHAPPRRKREK
jgi:hypothetical protein